MNEIKEETMSFFHDPISKSSNPKWGKPWSSSRVPLSFSTRFHLYIRTIQPFLCSDATWVYVLLLVSSPLSQCCIFYTGFCIRFKTFTLTYKAKNRCPPT